MLGIFSALRKTISGFLYRGSWIRNNALRENKNKAQEKEKQEQEQMKRKRGKIASWTSHIAKTENPYLKVGIIYSAGKYVVWHIGHLYRRFSKYDARQDE
ncbi:hypothetical protein AWENTII_000344 [Aspergillus wentii]